MGDVASTDPAQIKSGADKSEYLENHFMAVAGIKHLLVLPDSKSYLRTTAGFTFQKDVSSDDQSQEPLPRDVLMTVDLPASVNIKFNNP